MPDRLERHIALLHWVGRFRRVRSNRWARWLFVRCQELLVRAFGTSEVEREVELDDGTRLLCDLRDNLQLTLFLLGSYQADDLQTILDAIHPGSLFIDVGAHVGLFSATVARHMQDGKVISFEPSPDTAARLRINLELMVSPTVSMCSRWACRTNLEVLSFAKHRATTETSDADRCTKEENSWHRSRSGASTTSSRRAKS